MPAVIYFTESFGYKKCQESPQILVAIELRAEDGVGLHIDHTYDDENEGDTGDDSSH